MVSLVSGSAEPLSASGRSSEKLSLPSIQSKMKTDPEGYGTELHLIRSQFYSALELFQQQAALNFSSISGVGADPTVAKDLGDRAMFLAHVTPFYPKQLVEFPSDLAAFLKSSARTLPSGLRFHVTQALILLVNRKIIDIKDTLALFMELQTLDDRNLRKLAFSHVVHSIRRMNKNHKNEAQNRALQNVLFALLQQEDEAKAKRSLITLCELHRRKVWFDDRTANAICMACFHSFSRIMIAVLSFLLDYEKIEDDDEDMDALSSEDEMVKNPQVVINKETAYKAHHKGTTASKKKKKAKLQRAIRSMKRQQRLSSESSNNSYYSPLYHLKDAQGFAEKLFSRLQTCNERFEVKMMMLKVIARTVGLHRLILLNFYPFLQRYVQPHQKDITNLLAAAVQACHDMVPPDAVEPLFKQIVNQFVHDRSRPEAIAVGLNVIREICLRMPLLMNEDLLQDLVLYKKSHEKAVSAAARSLITLFREICPSLLVKKDRGRPVDPKAKPKAYGEVNVLSNVPDIELLEHEDDIDGSEDDESGDEAASIGSDDGNEDSDDGKSQFSADGGGEDEDIMDEEDDENGSIDEDESDSDDANEEENDDEVEVETEELDAEEDDDYEEVSDSSEPDDSAGDDGNEDTKGKTRKRKLSDFEGQLIAADTSLRALKKLAEAKMSGSSSDLADGILSDEHFQKIKKLKAKKEAKSALAQQGFKIPSSDQLSFKRVDPSKLEAHVRLKLNKEERLALVKAGREDRGQYQARTAIKQNKTGGLSNRQKEHRKYMPLAAKKAKAQRSRQEKNKKRLRSGKQFRGKKAWKQ
ncbi:putative trytophan synthase alpha subunit [Hibiscus syriacus]|uniref:Protein SDA1 n=1 Tax=Hibiscus syriacus TaxID=106335 RepID=A0A6A3A3N7_HIBSY|nr:protein SDA1 homolog [Hibiscus syriacus]KAE8698940.1 putative trytophan synthase alpha subunit [Hibiscus syriacus]